MLFYNIGTCLNILAGFNIKQNCKRKKKPFHLLKTTCRYSYRTVCDRNCRFHVHCIPNNSDRIIFMSRDNN